MSKRLSFIVCIAYAAVLLVLSALLLFLPPKSFSETENRMLAPAPALTAERLIDKSFSRDVSAFCNDHFPFRSSLLTLNSLFELSLGKLEANKVIKGTDGNLIKRLEYTSYDKLEHNISALEKIGQSARESGQTAVFFLAPHASDVLADFAPRFYSPRNTPAGDLTSEWLNITPTLRQKACGGEYVFYKTDHHWTSLGAYYAYLALGDALEFEPYGISYFTLQTISKNFLGTTYSASLIPSTSPDSITAYRYDGDENVEITDLSTGIVGGLYDFAALESSSKYNFFLGGNKGHIRVESGKPHLILIKDSFANSLIPFLAAHFDIDVIDPRYINRPLDSFVSELSASLNYPPILFLFSADTLATASIRA